MKKLNRIIGIIITYTIIFTATAVILLLAFALLRYIFNLVF